MEQQGRKMRREGSDPLEEVSGIGVSLEGDTMEELALILADIRDQTDAA